MLQVSNVTKWFGDNLVLDGVSFTLKRGQRAGLVGPNGCGKTTLLKIILGELAPDGGSAWFTPSNVRAGYLAQALDPQPGRTVEQVIKSAVAGLAEAEYRLETLSVRMSTAAGVDLQQAMEEYDQALEDFERLDGYGFQARAGAVLGGLGLGDLDLGTAASILSGGQKTRLGLARLLISEPDLLLLDEPTNHLDIDALEWLEGFLQRFSGAALMVSHDRTFLDRTVRTILELDVGTRRVKPYPGHYSAYAQAKEREREVHRAAYKDQQEKIARLESTLAARKDYARSIEQGTIDFGPRKIAMMIARKAVMQQRRIERLLDSEERIDRPERAWQMKMDFIEAPPSGQDVLQLEDVSMGFGDLELFRDVTLTLRAGNRIALTGPNGSGKTTLARLIQGELAPRAGRVRLGSGVKLGYFAQEQEDLDPESTPLQVIRKVAPLSETEARGFLHYFLFKAEEVFALVGRLSYGERARLTLARLVAQGCNFLLLDEPVNHLDISSRDRFEQAMRAYPGTVLAIVHDRYFVEGFATGVWAIEDGGVRTYADLDDMRRSRQRAA